MKLRVDRNLAQQMGFTLIEPLVVIAIIAVLAGTAMPAIQGAMTSGRQTRALSDARQVGIALRMYANDSDGAYPSPQSLPDEPMNSANDALRHLIIGGYIETEGVFAVAGSKAGPSVDNKIDNPSQVLARGENHWAYVAGLNSSSNAGWPLIADHTDGSGFYTDREADLGGTWKGKKAVVVRVDSSASIVQLKGIGQRRFLPRHNDARQNALQVRDYIGDGVKLLEPAS